MLLTRYPPSEFIKDYMRYNHISQLGLARATNIDLGMIKGILNNKVPITLEIANKLELSIGGHSQTWEVIDIGVSSAGRLRLTVRKVGGK